MLSFPDQGLLFRAAQLLTRNPKGRKRASEKPEGGKGLIRGCSKPVSFGRTAPLLWPLSPPARPVRGHRVQLAAAGSQITEDGAQAQQRADVQRSELVHPAASGGVTASSGSGSRLARVGPARALLCRWDAQRGAGESGAQGRDRGRGCRAAGNPLSPVLAPPLVPWLNLPSALPFLDLSAALLPGLTVGGSLGPAGLLTWHVPDRTFQIGSKKGK